MKHLVKRRIAKRQTHTLVDKTPLLSKIIALPDNLNWRTRVVHFWVGVTDNDWFQQISCQCPQQAVNFWKPSERAFKAISPGEIFLFKLHSPDNCIVGGGVFTGFRRMPIGEAWNEFGTRNGARSELELRDKLRTVRERSNLSQDSHVGCIILTNVFILPEKINVDDYADWPKNIVTGKRFDDAGDGKLLWSRVQSLRTPSMTMSAVL